MIIRGGLLQLCYDCVSAIWSSQEPGSSRWSNLSSFHLWHCAHSKPRYSIASDFVKPTWFLAEQSGNPQRRSISMSKSSRGKEKVTWRFGFMHNLECADLSALYSAITQQALRTQSGDKSPHSKTDCAGHPARNPTVATHHPQTPGAIA